MARNDFIAAFNGMIQSPLLDRIEALSVVPATNVWVTPLIICDVAAWSWWQLGRVPLRLGNAVVGSVKGPLHTPVV